MFYQFKCKIHGLFEVQQHMVDEHVANCPECGKLSERVYTPPIHYMPDCLWNSDGSRQSPDDLPHVPSGRTKWTHGWSPDK